MFNKPPIIQVENLSKRYVRTEYRPSLRHEATQMVNRWLGKASRVSWQSEPFWALKDVSFTIHQGESVGIVGRNGSGKTTLLRTLSNITDPTEGSIAVHGRFRTLIGLSAGFDFQRTGRENIYFNSAIYGFPPAVVDKFIEDIIEFSELRDFLDTPVKRYSSGMVSRLGFSIAIHMMPEIIFLDEILSVGDSAFQEKCQRRVLELKDRQCTILYVSHSEASVRMLCDRALWLHQGRLMMDGPVDAVLNAYGQMLHSEATAT
jgi:ABC-type polysaccharide/polyol phosphate transport system ATPase subunit